MLCKSCYTSPMKRLSFLLFTLSLTACTGLERYIHPEAPEGLKQSSLISDEQERYKQAEPVAAWWQQFTDKQLPALVEDALAHNPDTSIAIARVLEARALTTQRSFDYFPTVSSDAGFTRQRFNGGRIGGSGSQIFNTYNADLNASWEANFLGRVSERVKAQEANTQATEAELANTYVIIASDVASNYMALRGTQQRLAIAKRNEANQARTLDLTETLFEGGRATKLDTARAETQLQLTRATIPPLEALVSAYMRRLSILTGKVPDALYTELADIKPLPSLPYAINVGNLESLLKRRPDVLAAERQLAASVAEYNVTTTEFFPTVNLIGSIGYLASSLSDFGTSGALIGMISPSLNWRLLDIGRVLAESDAADARTKGALAQYNKTVLAALEETQNALTNFHREEQRRAELDKAAAAAKEAAEIARLRFEYGADDFLAVLDAERTLLQAEDTLASSNIQSATNLIAIYKALGGGWQAVDMEQTLEKATHIK